MFRSAPVHAYKIVPFICYLSCLLLYKWLKSKYLRVKFIQLGLKSSILHVFNFINNIK